MTGRKINLEVSRNFWMGLKRLKKRYNAPLIDIADAVFDASDLKTLDELYSMRPPTRRKKNRGNINKPRK